MVLHLNCYSVTSLVSWANNTYRDVVVTVMVVRVLGALSLWDFSCVMIDSNGSAAVSEEEMTTWMQSLCLAVCGAEVRKVWLLLYIIIPSKVMPVS